ncbi:MAG: TonB-dependent receptor [Bacteroidales bacterium]
MVRQILFLILILSILCSYGQVEEQELFRLGEKDIKTEQESERIEIVSASRSEKLRDDLPVTVYVISREEIIRNGYVSLVDVLKDIPGIKVSQPGSGMEGETFLMDGLLGNYYCKILVDNIPFRPSVVSGMPIGDQLPIRQAERIEIIYGPAAAIYGADAISGVINIITHTSERPVWAQADIAIGNKENYFMDVMIGGKVGKNKNILKYTFYGSYSVRGDMNVKYDIENLYNPSLYSFIAPHVDSVNYYQAPFYKGDSLAPLLNNLPSYSRLIGFGLTYRGLKFNYTHTLRNSHSSIGQAPNLYAYYDPLNYWGEKIDRYSLDYTKSWKKLASTTYLSYLNYRLDNNSTFRQIYNQGDNGRLYKYAASDDINFEEVLTYNFTSNLELTGGFSFQFSGNLPATNDLREPFDTKLYKPFSETVNYNDSVFGSFGINPTNFSNLAGFLQVYYRLNQFVFIAGGRYDHHSVYGGSLNPRIGILYNVTPRLSFRTSYGQGFRAPSLYYTYKSEAFRTPNGILYNTIPDPDVKPELFSGIDFGIRHSPIDNIYVELVLLYHRLDDKITYSAKRIDPEIYPNSTDTIALSAVNDQKSRSELFSTQLILKAKKLVPRIALNTDLYITYSKGKEILPNNLGELNEYRNMPNWFVQFNLDFKPHPSWTLFLHTVYSGKSMKRFFPVEPERMEYYGFATEVKGYYTIDFMIRYKINQNFQAYIDIRNLFDAEYGGIDAYGSNTDLIYNPQYGRFFQVGLSFRME